MAKTSKNKSVSKAAQVKQPAMNRAVESVQYPQQLFSFRNLCIILAVISVAVYANTLQNGYAFDDITVITQNSIVAKGLKAIPEILTTPYRRGFTTTASNELYRPLSLVTFAMEYQFTGPNPATGHFFNILIFAGCVLLLFLFLDRLFERKKTSVAFIAALLFALHPIHTEVVANIKSRDELLCFFFAFLCLNLFIRYMETGKIVKLLLGFLCFLLSFLAKETVITFLAVIPLIFFFYRNEHKKRAVYITVSVVLAATVCLMARFSVLSYYHANNSSVVPFSENMLSGAPSFGVRLATEIAILGYYLKLLFIPYPLICDYSFNSISFVGFANIGVLISLVIYGLLLFFGFYGLVKRSKDPFVFAVLFFLASISLFSNIPFLIGTAMGERLLFFPSVGFCLAIALLIEKWYGKKEEQKGQLLKSPKTLGVMIPMCIIYVFITVNRNSEWADNYTLWSADVKKAPNSCRLNKYLAFELDNIATVEKDPAKQRQTWEEAKAYSNKALAIYPDYIDANYDLGAVYYKLKQYDSAILVFNKTLALDPDYTGAKKGLGNAFLDKQNYDSAEAYYKKVIERTPDDVDVINNLGVAYLNTKKYQQAIGQFNRSIILTPDNALAYSNLGRSYFAATQYNEAIKNFKKEFILDSRNKSDYQLMAASWQMLGEKDSATKYQEMIK